MISIQGMDKAVVLKALYDVAQAPPKYRFGPISEAKAKAFIDAGQRKFEYVNARQLNFDISGDEFDPGPYNTANGAGLAEKTIEAIRAAMPAPEPEPEVAPAEESTEGPVTDPEPVSDEQVPEETPSEPEEEPRAESAETEPAPAPEDGADAEEEADSEAAAEETESAGDAPADAEAEKPSTD